MSGPVSRMRARRRPTLRVLVIDRHPLVRRGIASVVNDHNDLTVIGEAEDVATGLALCATRSPTVVVLDLDVEGGGKAGCEALRTANPDLPVVVIAGSIDDTDLAGAVRAGARGYLLRDTSPDEFVGALRTVAAGESLLAPAMASKLLDEFALLMRATDPEGDAGRLSARELEVLALVAEGLGNRAIGERLFIAESTVKNHVRSIHEKLQVHSRMEAVVCAVRAGVLAIG